MKNLRENAAFKEVLKTLVDNGGKVLDTVHDTVGVGEQVAAACANELGIQNSIFWSLRGTSPSLAGLKAGGEGNQALESAGAAFGFVIGRPRRRITTR